MKKFIAFILAALFAVSAFAGSISRGGGSFSSARSFSSSPARSMGFSRPSAPSFSSGSSYSHTAPSYSRPSTSPSYAPAPHYSSAPAYQGPSSGSTFLSSMGGSFLGSWLGSSMGSHGNGGGTTVVTGGGAAAAPVGAPVVAKGAVVQGGAVVTTAPSGGSSGAGSLWQVLLCIVLLAIIVAVLWIIYFAVKSIRCETYLGRIKDGDLDALPFSPVARFMAVQHAFAAKDVTALRALLGPDMVEQVLADLPEEPTKPHLTAIAYTVEEATGKLVSIRFRAFDKMDNSTLDETWHFRLIGGVWVLDGIEQ